MLDEAFLPNIGLRVPLDSDGGICKGLLNRILYPEYNPRVEESMTLSG